MLVLLTILFYYYFIVVLALFWYLFVCFMYLCVFTSVTFILCYFYPWSPLITIASLDGRFRYTDYRRLPISCVALVIITAVIADFRCRRICFSRVPLFNRELFFRTCVKSHLSLFSREIPGRIMIQRRRSEERERAEKWKRAAEAQKQKKITSRDRPTTDEYQRKERRSEGGGEEDSFLVPSIGLSCELWERSHSHVQSALFLFLRVSSFPSLAVTLPFLPLVISVSPIHTYVCRLSDRGSSRFLRSNMVSGAE